MHMCCHLKNKSCKIGLKLGLKKTSVKFSDFRRTVGPTHHKRPSCLSFVGLWRSYFKSGFISDKKSVKVRQIGQFDEPIRRKIIIESLYMTTLFSTWVLRCLARWGLVTNHEIARTCTNVFGAHIPAFQLVSLKCHQAMWRVQCL